QSFTAFITSTFAGEGRDGCNTTQQLFHRVISCVYQNRFAPQNRRYTDLLPMLGVLLFFQLVASFRYTAITRCVVAPREFDGMADLFPLEIDRTIGSLFSVSPSEN